MKIIFNLTLLRDPLAIKLGKEICARLISARVVETEKFWLTSVKIFQSQWILLRLVPDLYMQPCTHLTIKCPQTEEGVKWISASFINLMYLNIPLLFLFHSVFFLATLSTCNFLIIKFWVFETLRMGKKLSLWLLKYYSDKC